MKRRRIVLLAVLLWLVSAIPVAGQGGVDQPDLAIALPGRGDLVIAPFPDTVWVLNRAQPMAAPTQAGMLYRLDLNTQLVDVVEVRGAPQAMVAAAGALWITSNPPGAGNRPMPVLLRFDPAGDAPDALDLSAAIDSGIGEIAYGAGSLWLTPLGGSPHLLRLDPASRRVIADIDFGGGAAAALGARLYPLAADDAAVWVVDETRQLIMQVDPAANAVVAEYGLPEGGRVIPLMRDFAAGLGALWYPYAASASARALLVIDAAGRAIADSIAPREGLSFISNLQAYGGYLWLGANTVIYRIDPLTRTFEAVLHPSNSGYIALSESGLWTVQGARAPAPTLARFPLPG